MRTKQKGKIQAYPRLIEIFGKSYGLRRYQTKKTTRSASDFNPTLRVSWKIHQSINQSLKSHYATQRDDNNKKSRSNVDERERERDQKEKLRSRE